MSNNFNNLAIFDSINCGVLWFNPYNSWSRGFKIGIACAGPLQVYEHLDIVNKIYRQNIAALRENTTMNILEEVIDRIRPV